MTVNSIGINELSWEELSATVSELNLKPENLEAEKHKIAGHNDWLKANSYEWKTSTMFGLFSRVLNLGKLKGKEESDWLVDSVSEAWVQGLIQTKAKAQSLYDRLAKPYL